MVQCLAWYLFFWMCWHHMVLLVRLTRHHRKQISTGNLLSARGRPSQHPKLYHKRIQGSHKERL